MTAKIFCLVLTVVAGISAHGTSHTSVSKAGESQFVYDIDHSNPGHWSGTAYPHGYGGLGSSQGAELGHGRIVGAGQAGGYGPHAAAGYGPGAYQGVGLAGTPYGAGYAEAAPHMYGGLDYGHGAYGSWPQHYTGYSHGMYDGVAAAYPHSGVAYPHGGLNYGAGYPGGYGSLPYAPSGYTYGQGVPYGHGVHAGYGGLSHGAYEQVDNQVW